MSKSRLGPRKRARKYCDELKLGSIINIATAENVRPLTVKEKAYRIGYVKARSELSKARKAWQTKHNEIVIK